MWILVNLLATVLGGPTDPVWPNTFTQTFNETTVVAVIGRHSTTGTIYYDWTTRRYRIDRVNGRYDRYCGSDGAKLFENTPCSHIVVDGNRYLYFEKKNECCYCCNSSHGCGILLPNWLNGATYIDEEEHMGVQTYKWNQKGLQDNFYYETVNDDPLSRVMVSLYQESDDFMDFKNDRTNTVPDGVLDLPSICSVKKTCSTASICTFLRESKDVTLAPRL